MPTFSIIITSYNQKDYLRQTIESALAQTLPAHEIIIADDCSSDGSQEMIQAYVSQHPNRVKSVLNPQNLGISENRNTALRQVNGDFVAISDGDDRYLPGFLEKMAVCLEGRAQAHCAYSNLYFIDPQGTRTGLRDSRPRPAGKILPYLATGQMSLLRAMVASYSLAQQVGFLDARFPKHDGFIFTLRLARLCEFAYTQEPLAEYRIHPRGDSKSFDTIARLNYLRQVSDETANICQDLPLLQQRTVAAVWHYRLLRWQFRADRTRGRLWPSIWQMSSSILCHPLTSFYFLRYLVSNRKSPS